MAVLTQAQLQAKFSKKAQSPKAETFSVSKVEKPLIQKDNGAGITLPNSPHPKNPILADALSKVKLNKTNVTKGVSEDTGTLLYKIERILMDLEARQRDPGLGTSLKQKFFGSPSIANQPVDKLQEFLAFVQNPKNAQEEVDPMSFYGNHTSVKNTNPNGVETANKQFLPRENVPMEEPKKKGMMGMDIPNIYIPPNSVIG